MLARRRDEHQRCAHLAGVGVPCRERTLRVRVQVSAQAVDAEHLVLLHRVVEVDAVLRHVVQGDTVLIVADLRGEGVLSVRVLHLREGEIRQCPHVGRDFVQLVVEDE